jgi:hypothetical protein
MIETMVRFLNDLTGNEKKEKKGDRPNF